VLTRQKTVLGLLTQAAGPLSPTVFVKLVFLLRHETELQEDRSFYDFVPYSFGPFSFTLYRDLSRLRQNGYVTPQEERVALCAGALGPAGQRVRELPAPVRSAVADVVGRYGGMSRKALIRHVYSRYPWFALNSKLPERDSVSVPQPRQAALAVYTAGYEGRSVEAFLNDLLTRGIHVVVDGHRQDGAAGRPAGGHRWRRLPTDQDGRAGQRGGGAPDAAADGARSLVATRGDGTATHRSSRPPSGGLTMTGRGPLVRRTADSGPSARQGGSRRTSSGRAPMAAASRESGRAREVARRRCT
jgi:hypothetical protein